DHVGVELAAGLPTIDRLAGQPGPPEVPADGSVDRVGQIEVLAVALAQDVTFDRPHHRRLGLARSRGFVVAAREVAVGDRVAVADQLSGPALRVGRVHAFDVDASGRAVCEGCEYERGQRAGPEVASASC